MKILAQSTDGADMLVGAILGECAFLGRPDDILFLI